MKRQRHEFDIREQLGEGTFGVVNAAWDTRDECTVALKIMKDDDFDEGFSTSSLREISILRKLSHKNIVALRHTILDPGLILVFEWCPRNLREHMRSFQLCLIPHPDVKRIMGEILAAISYCHRESITHRDLKPQNILIASNGQTKLADFGLTRQLPPKIERAYTPEVITRWYRPPEILLGHTLYDPYSSDMWSIGCIFAELIDGHAFACGDSDISQLFEIFKILGTPTDGILTTLVDWKPAFPQFKAKSKVCEHIARVGASGSELLLRLLDYDFRTRITAKASNASSYLCSSTIATNS